MVSASPAHQSLADLMLQEIRKVEFYKTDEITTDLIRCNVETCEGVFQFHEDEQEWDDLIRALAALDGFRRDWFAQVSQPPFAESRFVAFESRSS
ncbi:MAG: hypothetical protein AAGA34_05390 [Pseudomonadota bacterium]